MKYLAISIISALILINCRSNHTDSEKHQSKRDKINNVKNKIRQIEFENMDIAASSIFLLNEFLIILDYQNAANHIHIFDKNTFELITSTAPKGRGKGELVNIGKIAVNENERTFYVNDHGKHCIFEYNIDSVIANPYYIPKEKVKMGNKLFPLEYDYYNDTLSVALMMKPVSNNDFIQIVGKWNMNNGELILMPYEHPTSVKRRITYASSLEDSLYVECYVRHDLMTICDLDGNLKYNIYGPAWKEEGTQIAHYGEVFFTKNKIVALYSGNKKFFLDKNKRIRPSYPDKMLIFNKNGDYIETLDIGLQIAKCKYDKENHRVFMLLENEYPIQFAYLDLKEIID